jgi:hypothetical protein
MSISWFAVPRKGGPIMSAQFDGYSVNLFTQKGAKGRSMTMIRAMELYKFEGYLGTGLRYPDEEIVPDKVIT